MNTDKNRAKFNDFVIYYYDRILFKKSWKSQDVIENNNLVAIVEEIYQYCKEEPRINALVEEFSRIDILDLLSDKRLKDVLTVGLRYYIGRQVAMNDIYAKTKDRLKG